MKTLSQKIEIVNDLGLHTRAATLLVKKASEYASKIEIHHEGIVANAKSIMGILALGARKGTFIEVFAHGEDAEVAIAAVKDLVSKGFYESMA